MEKLYKKHFVRVELIRDKAYKQNESINSPSVVYDKLEEYRDKDREYLLCFYMSTRNTINGLEVVSIGSLNANIVHPREVFKSAILTNSAGVILAHNHPSGDRTASSEDIELTRRLSKAGEILGIQVLDHVVITHDGFTSMKEEGLI